MYLKFGACSLAVLLLVSAAPVHADQGTVSEESDAEPSYRPGIILVKLRRGALPLVPVGDSAAALEAVRSSALGGEARSKLDETIRTYGLRFDRPLFTIPGKEPIALQSAESRRDDWFSYIEELKAQYPKLSARAPSRAEVPDLSQVFVVRVPPEHTAAAAAALSRDPHVEYAHLDYTIHTTVTPLPSVSYVPNDEFVTQNGTHWNDGAWGQSYPDLWGLQRTKTLEAWDTFPNPSTGPGSGVVVAVIDTGIDYNHNDLRNNVWINPGEDLNGNGVVDGTNTCPTPNGDFNCVAGLKR